MNKYPAFLKLSFHVLPAHAALTETQAKVVFTNNQTRSAGMGPPVGHEQSLH